MEFFTLLVNPAKIDAGRFTNNLRKALEGVHIKSDALILQVVPLPGGTGIVCDLTVSKKDETIVSVIRQRTASLLAAEMMDAYEEAFVSRWIEKTLGADNPEGAVSVKEHCKQLLKLPSHSTTHSIADGKFGTHKERQTKLAGSIDHFLKGHTFLHVEGFWVFRAEEFKEELKDTVSYAIDEWMLEQQYQEFISLLKYFVYIQEAKIPQAHVVHHGNCEFTVYDDQMLPIQTKQTEQFVVELMDKDINYEDVIVSTLISVSPAQLLIHTRLPEQQVIKTILTIFEGRAEICDSCSFCAQRLKTRPAGNHSPLTLSAPNDYNENQ